MLTQFSWCILVALRVDVQVVVSITDPMLRSLAVVHLWRKVSQNGNPS